MGRKIIEYQNANFLGAHREGRRPAPPRTIGRNAETLRHRVEEPSRRGDVGDHARFLRDHLTEHAHARSPVSSNATENSTGVASSATSEGHSGPSESRRFGLTQQFPEHFDRGVVGCRKPDSAHRFRSCLLVYSKRVGSFTGPTGSWTSAFTPTGLASRLLWLLRQSMIKIRAFQKREILCRGS